MTALNGKTALVTGASRGIGRAIALRLAVEGALVAVHYAGNDDAAAQTLAEIEQAGGRAFPVRAAFGTDGDIDALFTGLETGLAGRPLDILVNNAALPSAGSLAETTPETFDRLLAVNVKAPFFIIQRALAIMADDGRIINLSSAATRVARPALAHAMAKGAINALSLGLAQQVGKRGITVNAVAPGPTLTESSDWMVATPAVEERLGAANALDRVGRPADIAAAIAFLASDDARWVTGGVLDVTGGWFLGPRD
ncbi:SDR family NAD(P)-dependent oxidoreductase [Phytomonospora endophytica]|uniref:NAD(P)-dependent dehydrogenase (Short-subunit alcohol dehydrogenase family) n=1 Tax=Phytomonospora endophytica TaxID=714109 RepID=A0A841FQ23_9ACTN|nr:SDR family oxidoreductase [Phytomonospora endophytica]MBB6037934.1 NAD(P)-dependent dehydrogenase (short-subunit alcohol dehydrogenase family) [Phytomonospora endophytica]GIG68834.1 oxidoreductase [Phytomonospora endophytica]